MPSGDQNSSGEHLRGASELAHPVGQARGAGVAGIIGGDLNGGGRNRASVVSVIRGTGRGAKGLYGLLGAC